MARFEAEVEACVCEADDAPDEQARCSDQVDEPAEDGRGRGGAGTV